MRLAWNVYHELEGIRVEWAYGVRLVSDKVRQPVAGGVNEAVSNPLGCPDANDSGQHHVIWKVIGYTFR